MSLPFSYDQDTINSAAHVIQLALTPVFMLSGIGSLINVFNTRLARVSDHLDDVNHRLFSPPEEPEKEIDYRYTPARLLFHQKRLKRRMFLLDLAIILNALGGAATCGAAIALFVGSLRNTATATWLFVLFGIALSCTVASLMSFLGDTLLSWHSIRNDDAKNQPIVSQKQKGKKRKANVP
ncbi:DUF2721 domain-containing protein [Saccharibacter sp. 17.LH.SD]|uniref:DUF2721 domain-containing protein n=1 Tax=Saccharibacter sp. 17.LH.SD TaxID=2689393 RepID=UPI001369D7A7|nr:DUF2721 domain-containing protein [Saccharibacter sp. 17.LH.SD]MXV45243.1 DUF2721 domain-containing protein [Saccharibacter sp. 17.LH.SD]